MASLFDPLLAAGFTTLRLRQNLRTGEIYASTCRQWDPDLVFDRYRTDFDLESALTASPLSLGREGTQELYRHHDSLDALDGLCGLLRKGRHQGVDCWIHARRNIRVISNMHSNVLALDNRRHALRAGGIRRHGFEDPEPEVLVDGLNLARAMSFKNVAAQIPFGGSKICVHSDPVALDDWEALGFLGWCIDQSRSYTGPDMGFLPEHADALRSRFTRNIVGGPGGALGPTGTPTAEGVLVALKHAVSVELGRDSLVGLSVAVQGLGAVGGILAHLLRGEGLGRLVVADASEERVQAFRAAAGSSVEIVSSEEILTREVDVLSPNAVGGVLSETSIDQLNCKIILGAANNQLRATSREEELALADRIAARGILHQADWMHNGAGVIAGYEEWEHQENASMDRVREHVARVCGEGVRSNLVAAREAGIHPTAMAYRSAESAIYPGESQ